MSMKKIAIVLTAVDVELCFDEEREKTITVVQVKELILAFCVLDMELGKSPPFHHRELKSRPAVASSACEIPIAIRIEKGLFYALDLGGTNLSALRV
ncbi:hypothetical protein Pyn_10306 [Prunus yedoensis var. nudiflora]|uniref:Uncharacterized protein n=1 Tax=Prunus yedoensis var. nudiflora TaxID=2094558 RepID=A0A314ZRX5_PRUYE|nr:hypothetical protein Pyn_10306 [Prunus yedoensis var. nudiflora]